MTIWPSLHRPDLRPAGTTRPFAISPTHPRPPPPSPSLSFRATRGISWRPLGCGCTAPPPVNTLGTAKAPASLSIREGNRRKGGGGSGQRMAPSRSLHSRLTRAVIPSNARNLFTASGLWLHRSGPGQVPRHCQSACLSQRKEGETATRRWREWAALGPPPAPLSLFTFFHSLGGDCAPSSPAGTIARLRQPCYNNGGKPRGFSNLIDKTKRELE